MFVLLGVAVALAAFAAATLLGSLLLAVVWPVVARAGGRCPAAARARLLFALRILPAALGAIVAGALAGVAWIRFEPRNGSETLGLPLAAAAALSLVLLAVALRRGLRAWWAGHALARRWTAQAARVRLPGIGLPTYRISHPWPVVCVVGTLRPRLFVAESVLDACTPDELASVVAHERGHVATRDNLKRLSMRFLPDVLGWMPAGRALERAWETACETAADARAAAGRPGGSLDLAAALLRVARLARGGSWVELPARALLDGGSVAPRVERLLSDDDAAGGGGRQLLAWGLVLALPAALLALSRDPSFLAAVHRTAELLVQAR